TPAALAAATRRAKAINDLFRIMAGAFLMVLDELDRPLMFLGGRARRESAEIATFSGPRIVVARVQAVLPRFQFANHCWLLWFLLTILTTPSRIKSTPMPSKHRLRTVKSH